MPEELKLFTGRFPTTFNSPAIERVEELENGAKRMVVKQGRTWS